LDPEINEVVALGIGASPNEVASAADIHDKAVQAVKSFEIPEIAKHATAWASEPRMFCHIIQLA